MKTKLLIGMLILAIVLLSGCAEKECKTATDCLEKTCSAADCKDNFCTYSPVTDCCGNEICEVGEVYPDCVADCPNCDDSNACTTDSFDFYEQACVNEVITPCCGNAICDMGSENYTSCSADCPNCDDDTECTKDSFDYHEQECVHSQIPGIVCCGNGICEVGEAYEACPTDCPNCEDSKDCTTDSFDYHEQECVNEVITPCCGNEICDEGAEDYSSCTADCPDCDDSERLTGDSFNYATQKCEHVTYYFYEDFEGETPSWLDPRWTVADGVLAVADGADKASANFGEMQWTDYILRFKVKFEQGTMNVYVRYGTGDGNYGVTISENRLNLWKDIDKGINLEDATVDLGLNQFHDIAIEVKGNNIKTHLNGNLEIDYTDTDNPVPNGRVRLSVYNPGVYFDDIIVEEPI